MNKNAKETESFSRKHTHLSDYWLCKANWEAAKRLFVEKTESERMILYRTFFSVRSNIIEVNR